jgi:SAM-dependent methyltransferase
VRAQVNHDAGRSSASAAPSAALSASRYEYALETARRLKSVISSNILFDVGAGDGRLKTKIEAAGWQWHGFDMAPSSSEVTQWNLMEQCPLRGRHAGIILLLDVIEHLGNPDIALRHIFEVLEPNGRLVLTTPNPLWSRSRIHALMHGNPTCFTQSDLDLNGHVFTAWPHILIKMLHDIRFDLEVYVTLDDKTRWPGRPVTLRYPVRCAHALTNMLIERLDPSACGMSYGLILRARK